MCLFNMLFISLFLRVIINKLLIKNRIDSFFAEGLIRHHRILRNYLHCHQSYPQNFTTL